MVMMLRAKTSNLPFIRHSEQSEAIPEIRTCSKRLTGTPREIASQKRLAMTFPHHRLCERSEAIPASET